MGRPSTGNGRYPPPATDGEILNWEPFIRKIGLRKGVSLAEIEDFAAQVMLEFIAGEYLSKFDGSKGAWTTYFWAFVSTRAMRDRDKGIRTDRHLVWGEISEEYDEENENSKVLPADPVDHFKESEEQTRLAAVLDQLTNSPVIEVVYHVERTIDESGKEVKVKYRVERSLYTLARFLLLGLSQREIAKVYSRSVGTVASMVKELRQHPAMVRAVLGVHPIPNLIDR